MPRTSLGIMLWVDWLKRLMRGWRAWCHASTYVHVLHRFSGGSIQTVRWTQHQWNDPYSQYARCHPFTCSAALLLLYGSVWRSHLYSKHDGFPFKPGSSPVFVLSGCLSVLDCSLGIYVWTFAQLLFNNVYCEATWNSTPHWHTIPTFPFLQSQSSLYNCIIFANLPQHHQQKNQGS